MAPSLTAPSAEQVTELTAKYGAAGQGHVFAFWDTLSESSKASLFAQLSGIDPSHINTIVDRALNPPKTEAEVDLQPLPESSTASIHGVDPASLEKWQEDGHALIAQNKVAVVLMAGGQGTRLGSSAPKGCYDIGLPSHKSLFQLQGERIAKLQKTAGKDGAAVIPWYVMTSGPTRKPTEDFFKQNSYFGLDPANVVVFEQGVLPCISNEGKILLESKDRVAVAPDGNGGLYAALLNSGVVADMKKRGIEHIHAYCVDNCLVRVADPAFVGWAADKGADIATKVVRKRDATESVGLIVMKNGRPDVVEYSEIDQATAEAEDPKQPGVLKFRAANIVNHYYSFGFLNSIQEWADKLPHHVARKKIPTVDLATGAAVKPEKPNGIKLEQFVFDVFPMLPMEKFACLEVLRQDEFSPLKNGPGSKDDNPETSRRDIMMQGRRWLEAAGINVAGSADEGVEVSPLVSYGGEGVGDRLKGQTVEAPAYINLD